MIEPFSRWKNENKKKAYAQREIPNKRERKSIFLSRAYQVQLKIMRSINPTEKVDEQLFRDREFEIIDLLKLNKKLNNTTDVPVNLSCMSQFEVMSYIINSLCDEVANV